MSRNWADMGIAWESSPVSQQAGGHATDKVVLGSIPVPVLVDIDKAIKAGLGDAVLSGVNGTSWRVKAQDVGRRALEKDHGADREAMKDAIFARLRSIRAAASVRTVTIREHRLPDGTLSNAESLVEWQQEALGQYVDLGIAVDAATMIVNALVW